MRVDAWYLATAPLDMRSGMDSLLAHVVGVFGAAQPHVAYAFANARASRMKVLLHDGLGLWLCTRRLHRGHFVWPRQEASQVQLSQSQWEALSVGLPWSSPASYLWAALIARIYEVFPLMEPFFGGILGLMRLELLSPGESGP